MTSYRLRLVLPLLGSFMLAGAPQAGALPSPDIAGRVQLATEDASADRLRLAQAQPAPSPSPSPTSAAQAPGAPAASPSPAPAASDEPIGNVATLSGTATVIRNKNSIAIKLKDDIFLNDTVQTSIGASLGVTFNDGTTFRLSENARITIDTYVYEEGGSKNAGLFDVGKGTVAFVAASLAKTGDMHIDTPTSTLGIRGTTGLVEVPEGGATNTNNVNIKLYPDADGRVGQIEVNDRQGARLGTLTQGASGFSIRPGTGGARFAAVPLSISPQQAARDQGIVRQVHAAQTVGRQIVTEQRAIRRANPPGRPPGQQPRPQPNQQQQPRQPGQPQPGTQKGGQKQTPGPTPQQGAPKGEKQTPTTPNGQKQTPGSAPQPGAPNRQGNQQDHQLPTTPPQGAPPQPAAPNRQGQQQQPAQHPASAAHPQPKQPRLSAPQKGKGKKHLP